MSLVVVLLVLEGVFRHHEVQPALRFDERELDAHLEYLPDGDEIGRVRLVWNPAEQRGARSRQSTCLLISNLLIR